MPKPSAPVSHPLEQQIRERAYALWEQEGYPQGRDQIHWNMAAALVAGESAPVKARPTRKAASRDKPKLRAVR